MHAPGNGCSPKSFNQSNHKKLILNIVLSGSIELVVVHFGCAWRPTCMDHLPCLNGDMMIGKCQPASDELSHK